MGKSKNTTISATILIHATASKGPCVYSTRDIVNLGSAAGVLTLDALVARRPQTLVLFVVNTHGPLSATILIHATAAKEPCAHSTQDIFILAFAGFTYP